MELLLFALNVLSTSSNDRFATFKSSLVMQNPGRGSNQFEDLVGGHILSGNVRSHRVHTLKSSERDALEANPVSDRRVVLGSGNPSNPVSVLSIVL